MYIIFNQYIILYKNKYDNKHCNIIIMRNLLTKYAKYSHKAEHFI